MSDPEFWKKRYQDKWSAGQRRSDMVEDMIKSWGFEISSNGFLADSTKYSTQSPVEKGIPDLKISNTTTKICLLEVTGTVRMRGNSIWIRPDKFDYADNHPEEHCWLAHVEESTQRIRFIKIENKNQYEDVRPIIRGVKEWYKSIPVESPNLIESEQFKKILEDYVKD